MQKFVVAASKAVDKTWSKFLSNSVARKKACIEEALNVVFESKKGAKVMQHKIRKNKKRMSIDILTKTREWVQRKLHEIGRNKSITFKNKLKQSFGCKSTKVFFEAVYMSSSFCIECFWTNRMFTHFVNSVHPFDDL